MSYKVIVFDLDDTLYYEVGYLKSAFKSIAIFIDKAEHEILYQKMILWYFNNENVFSRLNELYPKYSIDYFLYIYRNHLPKIFLNEGAKEVFDYCKKNNYFLGLLTDGRSITQRNKIKALGIASIFDKIIISEEYGIEKPDKRLFAEFEHSGMPGSTCYYIGDNYNKDFISPNNLNWVTIGLKDRGMNIHKQNQNLSHEYMPQIVVENLFEIIDILKN